MSPYSKWEHPPELTRIQKSVAAVECSSSSHPCSQQFRSMCSHQSSSRPFACANILNQALRGRVLFYSSFIYKDSIKKCADRSFKSTSTLLPNKWWLPYYSTSTGPMMCREFDGNRVYLPIFCWFNTDRWICDSLTRNFDKWHVLQVIPRDCFAAADVGPKIAKGWHVCWMNIIISNGRGFAGPLSRSFMC